MNLTITGNVLLRFRNGDFRWLDLKLFEFNHPASDKDLLGSLISHPHFRDGYIGGGPTDAAIHGPYRLEAITRDNYQQIDPAEAVRCLDEFCMHDGPPPEGLKHDIDAIVRRRLIAAAARYRLPPLPDARHDLASVLTKYEELVLIGRDPAQLTLVVMGED